MEQEYDYSKETLLIVDDEVDVGKGVKDLLLNLGFNADFLSNGKDALQELRDGKYSFLITDIVMPELNGIELIKRAKRENPRISVIAMTGYFKDFTYMDVVHAGASDFISKPFRIDEMEAKIKRILIEREIREELNRLSITDDLTGLFNQRHFYKKLREEIARTNRLEHPLSLILLDLDNFKAYNDRYGHLVGDKMLAKCGKIVLSNIRENVDIAFRYGGDEFAVILVETDINIAQNIRQRLEEGFVEDGTVTASTGIASYSKEMSETDFIALTDKNLYRTKNKDSL